MLARVSGERVRVGGGGESYRRPGSPRRTSPREEARDAGSSPIGLGCGSGSGQRSGMTAGPHLVVAAGGGRRRGPALAEGGLRVG
jgi:hypothetical protein